MKRTCFNCKHYDRKEKTCNEGGFSEIGNPHEYVSREKCNAWKSREHTKTFSVIVSKDNVLVGAFDFTFDEKELEGIDVDDLLAGTKGLIWDRLAEDKDISVKKCQEEFYVEDIIEE